MQGAAEGNDDDEERNPQQGRDYPGSHYAYFGCIVRGDFLDILLIGSPESSLASLELHQCLNIL